MDETISYRGAVYPWHCEVRQTLFNVEQGFVAATMDLVGVHLDTAVRKAVPFPPGIAAQIRAALARRPVLPAFQL